MAVVDTSSPLGALVHAYRDRILEVAARHRGRSVRVFGSVARGDAGENSDIDLLVDFEPGSSLFDLLHLTEELEQLLNHRVDVVSTGGLKDRDRRILAEAVDL
ncbi:MAG: nucleotidyltransferase family protein [Acidimicrobiales bacterium]|nr:nucleotidyltransferase family protein [Acidimicrobiales bacterium]